MIIYDSLIIQLLLWKYKSFILTYINGDCQKIRLQLTFILKLIIFPGLPRALQLNFQNLIQKMMPSQHHVSFFFFITK